MSMSRKLERFLGFRRKMETLKDAATCSCLRDNPILCVAAL